ncbi:MAG: DUF4149 domain-containing protein [Acidobacteria bacterium]|nr:MAG: DUF4149 domain-containing protein [Acidobacteriota bacterium]REK02857.1 MAG: DUF4149 domain-containing protein [Acidobacteriota bacterium]REK13339.1 MAG: DUF4149 domain-containing protein [Acidobacteriota bacterium]REK41333.1 MAG: DUF4149 domain-containing protein [Acidobacteriota bacterium]
MQKILPKIELLLLGVWLGAACFFSFGVAPSAFAVLPSNEIAGNLVNRTLMIINVAGIAIGVILILTSLIPRGDEKKVWIWLQRVLLVILAAGCAVGQFVIGFWLAYLRVQMKGPIDELAANDPLRVQFNQLHQYSVWVLVAAMVASLLAFFVVSRSGGKPAKSKTSDGGFEMPDDLKF